MEQNKQLKEILLNSAEAASTDFTESVMKKLDVLSAPPYYHPLVSPKLKKGFVFVFGAVVTAILSLCLVISLADLNFISWIQSIPLSNLNYDKLLLFIFIFWILFAVNRLFEKKVELNRGKVNFKHHD